MSAKQFTLDDLRRILQEGAGTDDGVDLDGNILDTPFEALGYDSLALLETGGRIEREYGISLEDGALTNSSTPRELVELVNSILPARAS